MKEKKIINGLNDQEVLASRQKYGENLLTPPVKEPTWKRFITKFEDPLIIILLVAGILSIAISCWVLFNVVRTLIGTFKVFLQGVPTDIDLPALEQAIAEVPEVLSTHDVHLWSIDGELHVLTIHVVFNPESCVSPTEVLALKERVRAIAKEAGVQHATIEMDAPDTPCGMEHCCD